MSAIQLDLEHVVCKFFQGCIKGHAMAEDTALYIGLRAEFCTYLDQPDDSVCKMFHIIYFSPSNYTRVMYRMDEFRDLRIPGNYTLIADHDSCWRNNWSRIEHDMEALVVDLKTRFGDVKIVDETSIESINLLNINISLPSNYQRGYKVLRDANDNMAYGIVPQDLPREAVLEYNLVDLK
jgi:hypothetical protein